MKKLNVESVLADLWSVLPNMGTPVLAWELLKRPVAGVGAVAAPPKRLEVVLVVLEDRPPKENLGVSMLLPKIAGLFSTGGWKKLGAVLVAAAGSLPKAEKLGVGTASAGLAGWVAAKREKAGWAAGEGAGAAKEKVAGFCGANEKGLTADWAAVVVAVGVKEVGRAVG